MWKTRLAIFGLLVLLAILIGLVILILLPRLKAPQGPPTIRDTATLLKQVQTVSQLVTVKYILEKVVVLEDPPKGALAQFISGDNRVVMVARGIVKAGVDLEKLRPGDLKLSGTNLIVALPQPEITDVYLDDKETMVLERKTGLFRKFDERLEQTARQQAIDELRRAAKYGGILDEADTMAREQIRHLAATFCLNVEFTKQTGSQ